MSQSKKTGGTEGVIELRRYPSRKLYNKNTSGYIRLPEVAEMIRLGAQIRVEDTETGEDVTRQLLLQIIMEQEAQSEGGMLSVDVLMDMVRMHQSKASDMMTGLFEQSMTFMRAQQAQFANQMTGSIKPPWAMFDPGQMQDVQRQYQQQLASFWGGSVPGGAGDVGEPAPEPAAAAEEDTSDADDLEALRQRLEMLEKKLSKK